MYLFGIILIVSLISSMQVPYDLRIVYLDHLNMNFDENEQVITPKYPLPVTSEKSGLCFDIGTISNDNKDERKALLEKVFGSYDRKRPFIEAQLVDNVGYIYEIDGSIMREVLKRHSSDDDKINMVVCSRITNFDEPENITSLKIKALQPFKADSVYWYTMEKSDFGKLEQPKDADILWRWRVLQETRIEREI